MPPMDRPYQPQATIELMCQDPAAGALFRALELYAEQTITQSGTINRSAGPGLFCVQTPAGGYLCFVKIGTTPLVVRSLD